MATGQGTRFVFEATEHLHQHVAQLKRRIQSLEQALASLQQERSSDPHPLLAEATDIDCGDADAGDPSSDLANMEDVHDEEALPMDLVGTLVVADEGVTRFYGPTGGSEVNVPALRLNFELTFNQSLLMLRAPSVGGETLFAPSVSPLSFSSPIDSTSLPSSPATSLISASTLNEWSTSCLAGFPLPSLSAAFGDPLSHLPSADEAMALVEIYFSTAGWLLGAITREQIEDDMLPAVYGLQSSCSFDDGTSSEDIDHRSPHAIAVLFAIFAVASAIKNASASGSSPSPSGLRTYAEMNGARRYHELAHACLSLRPVLQRPSVFTVQTLYLMSVYDGIAGGCEDLFKDSLEGFSAVELGRNLLSLAVHLSLTVSLSRFTQISTISNNATNRSAFVSTASARTRRRRLKRPFRSQRPAMGYSCKGCPQARDLILASLHGRRLAGQYGTLRQNPASNSCCRAFILVARRSVRSCTSTATCRNTPTPTNILVSLTMNFI